jgi:membrane carboxypeptidase/penicillin-binding protein
MNIIENAVREANKDVPEAVSSELYNAALEAIDDHEASRRQEYPRHQLPDRLYQALRAWTDMEYRKHLGRLGITVAM